MQCQILSASVLAFTLKHLAANGKLSYHTLDIVEEIIATLKMHFNDRFIRGIFIKTGVKPPAIILTEALSEIRSGTPI